MTSPQHSPATTPSRVVAVSTLTAMGVRFVPDDEIPDGTLAEIRPHSPQGSLPLISERMPLFYAEAETETETFRAVFPAPRRWFMSQFPMSILLNPPSDPSSIELHQPAPPTCVDAARGNDLMHRWAIGRTPRVTTLNYLKRQSDKSPALTVRTARALELLRSTTGPVRDDNDRLTIIGALSSVIDELTGTDDVSDEAA